MGSLRTLHKSFDEPLQLALPKDRHLSVGETAAYIESGLFYILKNTRKTGNSEDIEARIDGSIRLWMSRLSSHYVYSFTIQVVESRRDAIYRKRLWLQPTAAISYCKWELQVFSGGYYRLSALHGV